MALTFDVFRGNRYNRYLAVAARVVRRSLKEDKRLAAEKRGEMDLKFAKWEVSLSLFPSRSRGLLERWCGAVVGDGEGRCV